MEHRKEYQAGILTDEMAGNDPFVLFRLWLTNAQNLYGPDAFCMSLATTSNAGRPSCRIVLLKSYDNGGFVFYTNYKSRKGNELNENSNAAACFFWPLMEKQIRIEGLVRKISETASDIYFSQRPLESQIAAIVSNQSKVIDSRTEIEDNFKKLLLSTKDATLARPSYWGGYILEPDAIEFWQGREHRLNDRIVFYLKNKIWLKKRLAP